MKYILSIDQGTTSTTSILVNAKTFEFVEKSTLEFQQIYPLPGYVEHDLNDIWKSVEKSVKDVLKKSAISANDIITIGITNQRETICPFRKNGTPIRNAIVWQDRRTISICEDIKKNGNENIFVNKTGLPVDPYFSGTKIKWLLENSPEIQNAYRENDLLVGTVDTFLLYKLTNGNSFATEASNASRTLLMNIDSCNWDDMLLSIMDIDKKILPEIKDSFTDFGKTNGLSFLPDGIPITGILGDQQAALFGQAGYGKGAMKCTYGTGSFILLNTGTKKVTSDSGLLTTVGYKYSNKIHYALEGSCYITGAAVQWLRDGLQIIDNSSDIEKLANEIDDLAKMQHIYFLPFFTGIGSPHWQPDAKAAIVGLTRDSKKAHIARACLDGIALSINDLIDAMKKDTRLEITSLKVDGGAVVNNLLMSIQLEAKPRKVFVI